MNYTEALNYLDHMKRDIQMDLERLHQFNALWDYAELKRNTIDMLYAISNMQDTLMDLRDRKGDNAGTTIQDNLL